MSVHTYIGHTCLRRAPQSYHSACMVLLIVCACAQVHLKKGNKVLPCGSKIKKNEILTHDFEPPDGSHFIVEVQGCIMDDIKSDDWKQRVPCCTPQVGC